jgi:hypothetical protein
MRLKQRRSSETEGNLGRIIREVDDHFLRRAPARLPSASSATWRLLLLPAIGSCSRAGGGKSRLGLAKVWRLKAWWKAGGTYGFIYRDGEEIVALDRGAYPEKFGKWRGVLNRIAVGSFEFKLSRIRLTGSTELRSKCCSGMVLFGCSCWMNCPKDCKQGDIEERKWSL